MRRCGRRSGSVDGAGLASAFLLPQLDAISLPTGADAANISEGSRMTIAGAALLIIGSALFAVLARLDTTD